MVRAHVKQTPEEKKDNQKPKTPAKKKNGDTGSWPCKINGCNKVFAREADLKRHQRTTKSHSVPSFACPQCDATFTRTDALRRHQKSRHNNVTTSNAPPNETKANPDNANTSASREHTPGPEPDPEAESDRPSSATPKSPVPASASTSPYRHAMYPPYGAGRLPPPLPPPPAIMYDPHYPHPIAMPTSAARLHPWPPPVPPWPVPMHPPAAPAPPSEGSPSSPQSSPPPASAPPVPPPPPPGMYRMPPPYYPYYPMPGAPMYPYPPPPPEYFAHYGMMPPPPPGMPFPPYYFAPPGGQPGPPANPDNVPAESTSPAAASSILSEEAAESPSAPGYDHEESSEQTEVAVLEHAAASLVTAEDEGTPAPEEVTATETGTKEPDTATLVAALLRYGSQHIQEPHQAADASDPHVADSGQSSVVGEAHPVANDLPDTAETPAFQHAEADLGEVLNVPSISESGPSGASLGNPADNDETPMLNPDELLTQESLASPPPHT